jgi:hypothetical protein
MLRVKFWVTVSEGFFAVMVTWWVPLVPVFAVPLKAAVADLKVMPLGSLPLLVILGAGKPVVVTWNENADPMMALAVLALVMAGGWPMIRAQGWLAVPEALVAVTMME